MSNFRDWSLPKLSRRFHLRRNLGGIQELEQWLSAIEEITDFEKQVLDYLCLHINERLVFSHPSWISPSFSTPLPKSLFSIF